MSTPDAPLHRQFLGHLLVMPGWHKAVLLLAGLLAFGGGIGRIAAEAPRPAATATAQHDPTHATAFAGEGAAPVGPEVQATRADDGSYVFRLSPHAMRVGLSIVAGFFLGWLFRAFVKGMALLTALGAAALVGLSYFHVVNVDLSSARTEYASALHWLADQAARLKDVLVAHLPSTGGGTLGAWLGFRRR